MAKFFKTPYESTFIKVLDDLITIIEVKSHNDEKTLSLKIVNDNYLKSLNLQECQEYEFNNFHWKTAQEFAATTDTYDNIRKDKKRINKT